jgi:phosphohistidine phosphatase
VDVFLIRHAAAIDETLELRDPMRHLTPDGRMQAVALGDRLRWHDCTPTQIWTSPLVRAVQTAELVAAGLKTAVAVEVVPLLAPGESARALLAVVQALPADASVLLVRATSLRSPRRRPRGLSTARSAGAAPGIPKRRPADVAQRDR